MSAYSNTNCGKLNVGDSFFSAYVNCANAYPRVWVGQSIGACYYGEKTCFAGSETVMTEEGVAKPISKVVVGDRIMATSASGKFIFSDVVSVPHGTNNHVAKFTQIATKAGAEVKLTSEHLIMTGPCGAQKSLAKASSVTVGSCLVTKDGEDRVVSVTSVRGKGLYSVVTMEEFIVVNGIVTSPYAVNHMLFHMYYNIHRTMYRFMPAVVRSETFVKVHQFVANLLQSV